MQPGTLRALEFDRIVEAVRRFALTPMGADRLSRLQPSIDPQEIEQRLAQTTEAVRYVTAHGMLPLGGSDDLPEIFDLIAVEGRALDAGRLLALAAFLDSVDETRAAIRRAHGSFARLEAASAAAGSFRAETAETREKIDPSGEVVDHASPELKSIRERLRKQRGRLRTTLESYLRGRDTAKYLQDQVVTERGGRYVLLIRAEHRSAIPGIVHGSSTSGASLFLEPLSTVEINNDIVALEEQEREEVWRVLLALTDAYRRRAADLRRTIDAATELDVVQARARFSDSIGAIEPAIATDGSFELQAARHPLLKDPVGVTITVRPPSTVLLITGPNTGGKTVALKTAGLLVLMAQAGLHVPAAGGSRLPAFRSVFADIGDEQSIDANLSTFSGHIAHIVSMDRELARPALVLLDEVGSGTDPVEGGALGVAIVDHFRHRGATVIATSHYDALKTYASTAEGVTCAAFGFDADSFAPTYQLVYGSPGRSLALEAARRLGLNPAIVASARDHLSAREAQLADHLARVDRDMRALEHERRLVAREHESLEAAEARARQREEALRQREEVFRRRLTEELDGEVRRARREIDQVMAQLKGKAEAMAREAGARATVPTGETGAVRSGARTAVDRIAERHLAAAVEPLPPPAPAGRAPAVGDRVLVAGLGLEAIVTAIHDDAAELDLRGKRMRAHLGELRVAGPAPAAPARVTVNVELAGGREPAGSAQAARSPHVDLNVIGCSVDEAIERAERFLDASILTDQRVVRVIHGYGTGQLKRALTGFLQQHPLVARLGTAPPEQGGGGVTVVELKE